MYEQLTIFDGGKRCSQCREVKSLDSFPRRNTTPCGYKPNCKDCAKAYYEANKERILARQHEYYKNNAEALNARRRERYRDNPEERLEAHRAWRKENPEKARESDRKYRAKYYKENYDKIMANTRKYQARKAGARVEVVSYTAILEEHGMVCHICGEDIESRKQLHFDHVVPISRGGEHSMANIRPSHESCNCRKSNKLMEEL